MLVMLLSLNDAQRRLVRLSSADSVVMCCPSRNKLVTCAALYNTDASKRQSGVIVMIKWHGKPISELRSVTCHMGSRSVNLPPDTGERAPP